ncbi:MAG: cupin domain-containing protein [Ottowia sp.]|nr:cupin domain-containing protein [Ottowia sp.]
MISINAFEKLKIDAKKDSTIGIAITTMLESEGLSFYATELKSHTKITPHYHKNGEEVYIILQGSGVMHTFSHTEGITKTEAVKTGDVFKIASYVTHQLENNNDSNLTLLFACPPSHLSEDRFVSEPIISMSGV